MFISLLRACLVAAGIYCLTGVPAVFAMDDMTNSVLIDPGANRVHIIPHATMLSDSRRNFSARAVTRGDLDHEFQALTAENLPINGAWLKFSLRNGSNHNLSRLLSYQSPMMREARLYQTPTKGPLNPTKPTTGVLNVFQVELDGHSSETYYLYLDSPMGDYDLVLDKPIYHIEGIVLKTQVSHIFYGAALGIFLYALILLATTKLPIYLWFASSIFAYTLTWAFRDGPALSYLPELRSNTQVLSSWVFINLSSIAFAKFFAEFLLLKERWPSMGKVINIFIAMWIVFLPLKFFFQTNQVVAFLTILNVSFFVFQLWVLIPMALARQRDALFYLGGYSVTVVIFTFMALQNMGLYADATLLNQLTSFGPQFGQFVWMMVMTYALGERFRETSEKQKEATRESQAKSSFLATMSHEIRTPMNGVLGMTELLNNTRMDTQQKSYVSAIYSSAAALLTILDDILDYSKIQSGKLELERIPINLYRFASDTVLVFAAMSQQKRIPLIVNIDEGLPSAISGDPTRIRQIVVNLLANAFKFTSAGHIALSFYRKDSALMISIRDTGIGISEQDQQHIFSTFSQADKSTNRKFGGSGLGLSICRDLSTVMGGSISVESELGIGCEFIVQLPMDDSNGETLLDIVPAEVRQLHALVYEPIGAKRQSLVWMMEGWGIQVSAAANIDEAQAILAKKKHLNVILTTTPGATNRLSADQKLFVVQLTRTSKRLQQVSNGVDYVLQEPICPGVLLTCLEELFCTEGSELVVEDEHVYGPHPSDIRVLVAEDNEINQRVICGMLNRLGVQPVIANNGDEAYHHYLQQQAENHPFDLILMDCEMPQVDGYEATRLIRAHESAGDDHVEIVALTANVLPEHRQKAHDIGMDEFLTKPIRLADLQQLFSNL